MQAALKFFDFPFNSAGGQGASKIGIKLPGRTSDQLSGDENGFMEIMAALTRMPPQELNTSLAQLDWVPVENSTGEFAPLIDLTDQASVKNSILQMLLPRQGTDAQTPRPPSQTPGGQADLPIDPGKNTTMPEMIKPPADADVEQTASATDARHRQAQDGLPRAVPNQVMPPDGATKEAADPKAVSRKSKGARPVRADRASETARQTVGHFTGKTDTASLPPDPLSGGGLNRRTFSDLISKGAPEISEHPVLQERIGQKVKHQTLNRAARIDGSPAMREQQFLVKPFEGLEMQMNNNASREGAPPFDSQLNMTAPKTAEASGAANETTPLIEKDTQTDVIRQIVQRMTLRSDRQQSQMVIRLKPDFLGNVRLQVTTEGQQVMVRMDAESAMVKEIVEQNMVHLKAELNQHGLEIEKFDVFVGNENDGWRSGQQQSGFRQASKRSGKQSNGAQSDNESSSDHSGDSDNHGSNAGITGTNEVDYFV
jgi:flagellar hook-length control protein FliK